MIRILQPTDKNIAAAARLVGEGRLVGLPTETVYGLAGDATSDAAVASIFAAKGRPRFNPLIVHVENLAAAARYGVFNAAARVLAEAFWPGPLTLVVPRRARCGVSLLASAGLSTLALRCPAHAVARAVIGAAGRPLAAPSANPSGRLSPTTASHVTAGFDVAVAMVLDGGASSIGLESTIIGFNGDDAMLLRPGAITGDEIEKVIGAPLAERQGAGIAAPGQLATHYAPHTPLRLDATAPRPGEIMIGFGAVAGDYNLSTRGDLAEAAANLFRHLHAADTAGAKGIAVARVPATGLGRAINDRLRRAAS